jgi:hypothetical protein
MIYSSLSAALRGASFQFACSAPDGSPFEEERAGRLAGKAYAVLGDLEAAPEANVPRWVKLALVFDRDGFDRETLQARAKLCEVLAAAVDALGQ